MILNLSWTTFKDCKDSNPSLTMFYKTESQYKSNDAGVSDINRYFLTMTLDADNLETFITQTDPKSSDQTDFEDNYKSGAIEVQ